MKLVIESTGEIVELNGVPARLWEGVSESGVKCCVFVTRVMVDKDFDTSAFQRELDEQKAPTVVFFV